MRKIGFRVESQLRSGLRRVLLGMGLLLLVSHCGVEQEADRGNERTGQTSSALLSAAWTATVSMNVARQNHVAALLQSGSILVAGGHPGNNTPTATAEVYNPATGAWTAVGSMSTARRLFGACTLASGKVLVAGGNAGAGDVTSAELFDPSTNTWSATGSLSAAREDFSMTCLTDGRVLVAGGSGPSGLLSSSEVYNPSSGTWSSAGTLPAAVHTQGAVLLNNGRVLVAGGNNASGPVSTAAIWTPSTNAWTATGSMATTRAFFALNLLGNGQVLAAGGLVNVLLTTTNKAEIYNPTTGTWSAAANLNTARYSGVSATLASGPMVVGGINGGSPLASSESYDSVHNTWTQVATAYGAVNQIATALTPTCLVVAGGNTGSAATTSAQMYGVLNVFALYAQRSVTLGSSDHINGGDVGVAAVAGSGFGTQLVVGPSVTVQTTHNLVAPSVSLGSGAHVGDVQTNSLTNSGGTLGTLAAYPSSMPAPPIAPVAGSGGSSVTVPALTITTLNPGNYGALSITGTAFLNAGSYTFSSVTMANQAHLAGISGTATVAVAGTFLAGNSVSISSPGSTPAGQLVIGVAGTDAGTTPAFSIGSGATVSAVLSAPNGTLSLGASTIATGAFAGFDVKLGTGVTITYQTGFPPANVQTQTYINQTYYSDTDIAYSFQTTLGQPVDCINFAAQHSVKALLAMGANVPTTAPTPFTASPAPPPPNADPALVFNGQPDPTGKAQACPSGTVPVTRPTVAQVTAAGGVAAYQQAVAHRPKLMGSQSTFENDCWLNPFPANASSFATAFPNASVSGDYDHAVGIKNGQWLPSGSTGYSGMELTTPIYAPFVAGPGEHTDSQLWAQTGNCENWYASDGTNSATQSCPTGSACTGSSCAVQSLEVVAISEADPSPSAPVGASVTRLKVFITPDGYHSYCFAGDHGSCCGTGNDCWTSMGVNQSTPPTMMAGMPLSTAAYGKPPLEKTFKVQKTGTEWWVFIDGSPIGFYSTANTFNWPGTSMPGPLATGQATYLQAGGEVFNQWPNGAHTDTAMVSDRPAWEGFKYAAYNRNVSYFDSSGTSHPADLAFFTSASSPLSVTSPLSPNVPDSENDFGWPGLCGTQAGGWFDSSGNPGTASITTALPGGGPGWGYYFYFGGGTLTSASPSVLSGTFPNPIAVGTKFTCVLDNEGGVECWGDNSLGELGNGSTTSQSAPFGVTGLATGVTSVSAGDGFACAVTTSSEVMCWGVGEFGELGNAGVQQGNLMTVFCNGTLDGVTTNLPCTMTPAPVVDDSQTPLTGFATVSAGHDVACALTTSGGVECWGDNAYGAVGNTQTGTAMCGGLLLPSKVPSYPCALVPLPVTNLSSGVASVSVGNNSACAVTTSGAVWCWGDNEFGQLGAPSSDTCGGGVLPFGPVPCSHAPVQVQGITGTAVSVSVGGGTACAVTASGAVWCWGNNAGGMLGVAASTTSCQGGQTCSLAPIQVPSFGSGVTSVSVGGASVCVTGIGPNGGVACWGNNAAPARINSALVRDAITVSVGSDSACTMNANDTAACWGDNSAGQLGNGSTPSSSAVPIQAAFP